MVLWERLRDERKRLGYNQADFGEVGGIKKQSQIRYEKGDGYPTADYLEKVAKVGADVLYIVTGTRQALAQSHEPARLGTVDDHAPYPVVIRHADQVDAEIEEGEYVTLRRFDLRAHAGDGASNDDFPEMIEELKVLKKYLAELGVIDAEVVDLLTVTGDSMGETAPHGSIAFLDRTIKRFVGDGIYALRWNDGIIIKRLLAEVDGTMAVHSDNRDKVVYPTRYLTPSQFGGLGILARVVLVYQAKRV